MSVTWRPKSQDILAVAHSSGVSLWSCEERDAAQARPGAILARVHLFGTHRLFFYFSAGRGLGPPSSWKLEMLLCGGERLPVSVRQPLSPCLGIATD